MRSGSGVHRDSLLRPDWRDGAAYAPLLDADRTLFAWEWLRRTLAYQAAARFDDGSAAGTRPLDPGAHAFGLVAFEPPALAVPDARPLWLRRVHPPVLEVHAAGSGSAGDQFDSGRFGAIARVHADPNGEHLLLCDGLRCIRLDGPRGTFTGGPARLRYSMAGLASAQPPLMTLRRLLALCGTGEFSRTLHPPEARARRWILALRASDALAAGAGQREIAGLLLGGAVCAPRWRSREPSVRSQAQRLVHAATRLTHGGYRALLR